MLFDLTSSRRRRTAVRVVYGTLAILMVVGLVLLGVGTGGGGPLDSNNGGNTGSSSGDAQQTAAVKSAEAKVKASPKSTAAYANLVAAYWSLANTTNNFNSTSLKYTAGGKAALEKLIGAWNTYSTLTTKPNEDTVLRAAYAMDRVGDFSDGVVVWQDVLQAAGSSTKSYECLAADAYASKKTALGAQALAKVIALTPKLDRTETQTELDELKKAAEAKAYAGAEC